MEGYGARLACRAETGPDELAGLAIDCLDELHRQIRGAGLTIAAVAACASHRPLLPIASNGHPTASGSARFWLAVPEYLFYILFGRGHSSTSLVSAAGLWNAAENDYDDDALRRLAIDRAMLAPVSRLDQPACGLDPEFARMWPAFDRVPWFPALPASVCACAGSGAFAPDRVHFHLDRTAALQSIADAPAAPRLAHIQINRRRFLLSAPIDAGLYAWTRHTLPHPPDLEARLESAQPGAHGLSVKNGTIGGITLGAGAFEIHHAVLESIALQARDALEYFPARPELLVSGALLHSPAWMQIIADTIARPVVISTESEPSSRGAALWALEQSGVIDSVQAIPASTGAVIEPRKATT